MAITAVTRRALLADLRIQNVWWSGDCDTDVAFLDRLYDLDALPSADPHYENARADAVQHLVNNPDWDTEDVFRDPRFKLSSGDDEPLLRFLSEMLHPEVRIDQSEVKRIATLLNAHLRPDGWELFQESTISGRPVYGWRPVAAPTVSLEQIRAAIAEAIAGLKSYEVAEFCSTVAGLSPSEGEDDDPHSSKRGYVRRRIKLKNQGQLLDIADNVLSQIEDPELRFIVDALRSSGSTRSKLGSPKNLVFASIGPKHEIVLTDALDNDVTIVKNAHLHLVYADPIGDSGLSWRQLVAWWPDGPEGDERERALALHRRLMDSADDGPERLILKTYAQLYGEFGFDIPALLPQVYLHYDPYSQRPGKPAHLARQRMDFLLLVPMRRRIVIELDGKQHYAESDGRASPRLYGEMMREDRRLRLAGYELFRIGGDELKDPEVGGPLLRDFFIELLRYYDVTIEQ